MSKNFLKMYWHIEQYATHWVKYDPLDPYDQYVDFIHSTCKYYVILFEVLICNSSSGKITMRSHCFNDAEWCSIFRQFCDDAIFRAPNASLLEKRTPLTKSWAFTLLLLNILCGRVSWWRTTIYKNIHLFWLWSVRVTVRLSKMAKIMVGNNGTAIYASGSLSAHNL